MEDIKDKVDKIIEDDKDNINNQIRECVKENIEKIVSEYFKDNGINQYKLEDALRTKVKDEIKSAGFLHTQHLDENIIASVKTNTEKYVSELVREEVYNILKKGELREIVQESIKAILPEIIYYSLLNTTANEIYQNREESRSRSIQDVMNIVSDRLKM